MRSRVLGTVAAFAIAAFAFSGSLVAQEVANQPAQPALALRIDQLLAPDAEPIKADEQESGLLLRRLSLDLRGVVPTRQELDAFLADEAPDRLPMRWSNWVEKFLADPLCDEHLVTFLDRTLMLRRPNAQVDRVAWISFLREQVAVDVPLDELSKQLLFSPWWNREHRPAQKFFLERGGDPNLIARDIGRVFLGRDMQCAQCHDHPIVDDYKQIDYHGLLAYVSTSGLAEATYKDAEGKDQKVQLYVERAAGDAPFESVFDKGVAFRSGPRMIGKGEQFETYAMPDSRYATEPAPGALDGVAMPPKVSRRQALAEQLTSRNNRDFVANWANRFWSLSFGHGLVQPLDMHHPHNPASHPALFELITDGLLESDMRPRVFLRQLVLSEAYRRGGVARLDMTKHAMDGVAAAEMSATIRAFASTGLASANEKTEAALAEESRLLEQFEAATVAWRAVQGERAAIRSELDTTEAAMLASKKKSTDAEVALTTATKAQVDTASRISLLDDSASKLQQAADLAGGEDAALKQAIVVAKQRADAARAMGPPLEKSVADTKATFDASLQELATTTAKVQEVVNKLEPVHLALAAADTAMIVARNEWSAACRSLKTIERKATRNKQVLAWLDESDKVARLALDIQKAHQDVASIEAELPQSMELVKVAMSQVNAATTAEQNALSAMNQATETFNRHALEISQLQRLLEALADSTKLVASAESIPAAQAAIQKELDVRQGGMGMLQMILDVAKQAASSATAVVATSAQELVAQQTAAKAIEDRISAARTIVANKESELASEKTLVRERWASLQEGSTRQLSTASLQPLTPEQICWSTLRVTGVLDAYVRNETTELEKQSPLPADADETMKAARHRLSVRGAYDKLRGIADTYVSLYASGPDKTEDDFFASADQALYTANAGNVYGWAAPGNDNVTQQAIALTDNAEIAKLIYWTLLCRHPASDEMNLVNEQIATAGDGRNTVIQEMVWGLLASTEFRFVN